MSPLHVVAILSLSAPPGPRSSTTDDATTTTTPDDVQPSATDENPVTSPASTDDVPASEPDPFDDSTWEGLTVEQRDELRAQRARLQAEAADERAGEQTLAGVRAQRINFQCVAPVVDPTDPGALDTSAYDRCLDWVERGNALAVPVGLLATSAVLSMVGTIVVGTVWGNHRNNRAVLELGWLRPRMAWRR